jgi:hypothetical protein
VTDYQRDETQTVLSDTANTGRPDNTVCLEKHQAIVWISRQDDPRADVDGEAWVAELAVNGHIRLLRRWDWKEKVGG